MARAAARPRRAQRHNRRRGALAGRTRPRRSELGAVCLASLVATPFSGACLGCRGAGKITPNVGTCRCGPAREVPAQSREDRLWRDSARPRFNPTEQKELGIGSPRPLRFWYFRPCPEAKSSPDSPPCPFSLPSLPTKAPKMGEKLSPLKANVRFYVVRPMPHFLPTIFMVAVAAIVPAQDKKAVPGMPFGPITNADFDHLQAFAETTGFDLKGELSRVRRR